MMFLRAVFVVVLALVAGHASAQERILSFDSVVGIAADGSLDVTETITVRAEGESIRRGIYRDFPTRYRDQDGRRFVVEFDVVSLTRNGQPEPWFTEGRDNGVRVNFGNDDFLPVPAEHTYVLRYTTTRQVGFYADHDELYWNATGNGWDFIIERATARIDLPEAVDESQLRTDAYTGPQGATTDTTRVVRVPRGATWTLLQPLAPDEGMTVVLGFPKGLAQAPTEEERMQWWLRDMAGPFAALFGFLALLSAYLVVWWRIGRDPRAGTIIPQYEPPAGHTPGGLRYLRQQMVDPAAFSADIVALGVNGALRIERDGDGGKKDAWTLRRLRADSGFAHELPPLRAIAEALFKGSRDSVELKPENAVTLTKARQAHAAALGAQYRPRYFRHNAVWIVPGALVAFGVFAGSAMLSNGWHLAILASVAGLVASSILVVVFAFLLRQRTPEGRALLDRVEGLRRYLGVAEREELARLDVPEPAMTSERYQALLPYALALDVEAAWTKRFTAAVGEAAAEQAARESGWIGGSAFLHSGFGQFGNALGAQFSSQISAAASPPGSGSGGGGGGFSGGGGGGGGGGGR